MEAECTREGESLLQSHQYEHTTLLIRVRPGTQTMTMNGLALGMTPNGGILYELY